MVTITILADNRVAASSPRGLRGEWGFAAPVGDVLLDTGYGGVVPENAARLGRPLDGRRSDSVPDDQALAVETDDGVAVVLGCGHAGLRNTVEYAESVTGGTVRTVAGGTHLVVRDDAEIHELGGWLDGRLDRFGAAHCTGSAARRILADRLPGAFQSVGVGTEFEL